MYLYRWREIIECINYLLKINKKKKTFCYSLVYVESPSRSVIVKRHLVDATDRTLPNTIIIFSLYRGRLFFSNLDAIIFSCGYVFIYFIFFVLNEKCWAATFVELLFKSNPQNCFILLSLSEIGLLWVLNPII